MVSFAEPADLASLLGREFTTAEETQVTRLMEDASTYLRTVIGQQVFPRTTSTYTAYPFSGREDLPQWPVVSVDAVERDGVDVEYTYRPGYIVVRGDDPVDVTFTWGFEEAPDELRRLTCVLVSQALQVLEASGGLSSGGLSSVAIDDFRVAFGNTGDNTGISLTRHAEVSIRRNFGRGDVNVVEAHA